MTSDSPATHPVLMPSPPSCATPTPLFTSALKEKEQFDSSAATPAAVEEDVWDDSRPIPELGSQACHLKSAASFSNNFKHLDGLIDHLRDSYTLYPDPPFLCLGHSATYAERASQRNGGVATPVYAARDVVMYAAPGGSAVSTPSPSKRSAPPAAPAEGTVRDRIEALPPPRIPEFLNIVFCMSRCWRNSNGLPPFLPAAAGSQNDDEGIDDAMLAMPVEMVLSVGRRVHEALRRRRMLSIGMGTNRHGMYSHWHRSTFSGAASTPGGTWSVLGGGGGDGVYGRVRPGHR
ncbi:hypothetical protein R3P38DRAFT_3580105 [Favolaschia claudopus]|uniref:Uncharacterized protein n=1 Tax=Favolaschia claudopus TaxID=2862362 RepID=A0AAW0AKE8_9AGAR